MQEQGMEREIEAVIASHSNLEVFENDIKEWSRSYRLEVRKIDDLLYFVDSFIESVYAGRVKRREGRVVLRTTKRVFHALRRCLNALNQEEDTLEILIALVLSRECMIPQKRGELRIGALTWRLHLLVEAVEAWQNAPEYIRYEAAERAVDGFCSGTRKIQRRKI